MHLIGEVRSGRRVVGLEITAMSGPYRRLIVAGLLALMALSPFQPFGWMSANDELSAAGRTISPPIASESGQKAVIFGVYPDAGNGQVGNVSSPEHAQVIDAIQQLRGNQPFDVHLYTAWSWHNDADLDAKINAYTAAGLAITLTIKYSPPVGRDGDVKGYAKFVQQIVRRYGSNAAVQRYVIGNEANVTWGDPSSSDGPFKNASRAVVDGVAAASQQLALMKSPAQIGTSMAIIEPGHDARFLQSLATMGGRQFVRSVSFIGINVYPGIWPVGSGDPYADMVTHLRTTRSAMSRAGFASGVSIAVLENGFPTADDADQSARLTPMVKAVCSVAGEVGVSSYSWFGLIDSDSWSDNPYAHFRLLRSDLSKRPSFDLYKEAVATACPS
ncbi:MAG TPA: hypothetical protein PKA95_16225 [Thermomicrobiales bacterium]|nr:hypothetical protein [Thermomicrobiales bacterium]